MAKLVVILAIIAILLGGYRCYFSEPPIKRAVALLNIPLKNILRIDEERQVVVLHDETTNTESEFAPLEFTALHGIKTQDDVASIDDRISQDLRRCTSDLLKKKRLSNFVEQLRFRSHCLTALGWTANDQAYINAKARTLAL